MRSSIAIATLMFPLVLSAQASKPGSSPTTNAVAPSGSTVKIAAINFPPVAMQATGGLSGIGVDVVKELLKRGDHKIENMMVELGRILQISSADIAIFPAVTRSAERETAFRWVGKLFEDRYCFVTMRTSIDVNSIEMAKGLRAIGVNSGGATETFAVKNGLTNLDRASENPANARKLLARRIDAWLTSEIVATYTMRSIGTDPSKVNCSGDLARPEYWIAASKKMPDAQFAKLKSIYEELVKEGFVTKAIEKYK